MHVHSKHYLHYDSLFCCMRGLKYDSFRQFTSMKTLLNVFYSRVINAGACNSRDSLGTGLGWAISIQSVNESEMFA